MNFFRPLNFPRPPGLPDYPPGVPREVSALFEMLALEVISKGWDQYSARAILHRIRWHKHIERGDREFKCNNNWTPTLARWFMRKYPRYDGFFETRIATLRLVDKDET